MKPTLAEVYDHFLNRKPALSKKVKNTFSHTLDVGPLNNLKSFTYLHLYGNVIAILHDNKGVKEIELFPWGFSNEYDLTKLTLSRLNDLLKAANTGRVIKKRGHYALLQKTDKSEDPVIIRKSFKITI